MEQSLERINSLKARLDSLQSTDPAFQAFGARHHKYQIGTPMTNDEMLAFEKQHAIALPEEYRTFLLLVGREGAGPYYGLFPPTGYLYDLEDVRSDFLSLPFPHKESWNLTEDAIWADEHAYFSNNWIQGSMRLSNYGCGAYCALVITGQARGQIWLDYRSSDNGIFPIASDFLTWYEQWLERSFIELKSLPNRPPTFRRRIFDKNGQPI